MNETLTEIPNGASVLVSHPYFGSLWMEDVSVENGYVVGTVWDMGPHGPNMPEGNYGIPETMNFPVSCVRKVDRQSLDSLQRKVE